MVWSLQKKKHLGDVLQKLVWPAKSAYWKQEFRRKVDQAEPGWTGGPKSVIVVLDRLYPHINPGMIVRSADALGAHEVILVGMDYFNPSMACGTVGNIPIRFAPTMAECRARLVEAGYRLFALEPSPDIEDERYLDQVELPEKTAFIVGNESRGVSFTPAQFPDIEWVAIRQYGKVRCMNASVASSIALYEYTRQHP